MLAGFVDLGKNDVHRCYSWRGAVSLVRFHAGSSVGGAFLPSGVHCEHSTKASGLWGRQKCLVRLNMRRFSFVCLICFFPPLSNFSFPRPALTNHNTFAMSLTQSIRNLGRRSVDGGAHSAPRPACAAAPAWPTCCMDLEPARFQRLILLCTIVAERVLYFLCIDFFMTQFSHLCRPV